MMDAGVWVSVVVMVRREWWGRPEWRERCSRPRARASSSAAVNGAARPVVAARVAAIDSGGIGEALLPHSWRM